MLRVLFLRRLKRVFHSSLTKLALIAVFTTAEFFLISIPNVLVNMSHAGGLTNGSRYLFSAALHTELIVQFLLVGLIIFGFLLVRTNFRYLHHLNYLHPRRLFFWRAA